MNLNDVSMTDQPLGAGWTAHYPTELIDVRMVPTRPRQRPQQRMVLRAILPQDDHLLADLINRASVATRQRRFPSAVKQVSVDQLSRLTCVDYRRHLAVVVTTQHEGREQIVAEARYLIDPAGNRAEFTLMVDDAWQRRGLGTWALLALSQAATAAGVDWLWCDVPAGNEAMLALMQHCRFCCAVDTIDERIVHVETRPRAIHARRPQYLPRERTGWVPRWWPGQAFFSLG